MRAQEESSEDTIARLSSWYEQDIRLSLLHLLEEWKEKQLGKLSIILELGENSRL